MAKESVERGLVADSVHTQIRSNMHGSLVRKFLDLMQEYQAMLTKYDKKFRDKAYKEVQIGNVSLSR